MRVLTVVGARPNFIKLSALHRGLATLPDTNHCVVHTGQHYDFEMNEQFFQELRMPEPRHHLGIGSGSHAEQVGRTMMAIEPILSAERPDWTCVVGDVNAAAATAITAKKLHLRVCHVEAGLRSNDWRMPEEINRVLTDRISDLLLVTEPSGLENLRAEAVSEDRVVYVGNPMIDTLFHGLELSAGRSTLADLGLEQGGYGLVTMHRPSNTDDPELLRGWMRALVAVAAKLPLIFPVHPRTQARLEALGDAPASDNLRLLQPAGYLDMVALLAGAKMVLTDSGGIQEETTALGVPCLTLRENTERPVTVTLGTNTLLGADPSALVPAVDRILAGGDGRQAQRPEGWDGQAGPRIAASLAERIGMAKRAR